MSKKTIFMIVMVILVQIFAIWHKSIFRQVRRLIVIRADYKIVKDVSKTYGEPFVMDRTKVYPKRYVGTERENDDYYKANIYYDRFFPLKYEEIYSSVALNISANDFYRPKAEELFGKNVVLALEIPNFYKAIDYKEALKELEKRRKKEGRVPNHQLEGAIYIYGRVDSDADREEYREKIWEFINYIKEVGAFGEVDLGIIVVDERVLTDQFVNDKVLKADIVEARFKDIPRDEAEYGVFDTENLLYINTLDDYEYSDDEEFRVKRRELMSKITEPVDKSKKHERLENINIHNNYKSKGGIYRTSFFNSLLYAPIVSTKKFDTFGGSITKNYIRTDFEKESDVYFNSERY